MVASESEMPSANHPQVSTCEFVVPERQPGSKIVCRPYAAGGIQPDYVIDRQRGTWVYFREIEKIVDDSRSAIFNLFPGNEYQVAMYDPSGRFTGERVFSMPDNYLSFDELV